jgi:hypothetical protein
MNCLSKLYDKNYDRIRTNLLHKNAILLPPRHKTFKHFKKDFDYQNKYEYIFTDRFNNSYKIFIDVRKAFRHFNDNTYNEFRSHINASLKLTLIDPLFVVTENSLYDKLIFYKSFYKFNDNQEKEFLHIISLSVEKENENFYRYKTTYEISNLAKLKKWILLPEKLILYCSKF